MGIKDRFSGVDAGQAMDVAANGFSAMHRIMQSRAARKFSGATQFVSSVSFAFRGIQDYFSPLVPKELSKKALEDIHTGNVKVALAEVVVAAAAGSLGVARMTATQDLYDKIEKENNGRSERRQRSEPTRRERFNHAALNNPATRIIGGSLGLVVGLTQVVDGRLIIPSAIGLGVLETINGLSTIAGGASDVASGVKGETREHNGETVSGGRRSGEPRDVPLDFDPDWDDPLPDPGSSGGGTRPPIEFDL